VQRYHHRMAKPEVVARASSRCTGAAERARRRRGRRAEVFRCRCITSRTSRATSAPPLRHDSGPDDAGSISAPIARKSMIRNRSAARSPRASTAASSRQELRARKPMKVWIGVRTDPLLFLLSQARCRRSASSISRADWAVSVGRHPRAYNRFPDPGRREIVPKARRVRARWVRGTVRRVDGTLRRHQRVPMSREDHSLSQRSDPVPARRSTSPVASRAASRASRARANLERARCCGVPEVLGSGTTRPARDALHRIQIRQRYRACAPGACMLPLLPGRAYRAVDRGVDEDIEPASSPGCCGNVHALRSQCLIRHHPEGLGLQARSVVPARQLQQPYSHRRLHPLRMKLKGTFPLTVDVSRTGARSCGPSSAHPPADVSDERCLNSQISPRRWPGSSRAIHDLASYSIWKKDVDQRDQKRVTPSSTAMPGHDELGLCCPLIITLAGGLPLPKVSLTSIAARPSPDIGIASVAATTSMAGWFPPNRQAYPRPALRLCHRT